MISHTTTQAPFTCAIPGTGPAANGHCALFVSSAAKISKCILFNALLFEWKTSL
jgi:hypothetical protein